MRGGPQYRQPMRTRSTRDLMLGFAIAAALSVEYLTDGSLSTADHVVGCAVAVGIGTLVAIRHRVPLGLLAATALLIAIRTYVPPGGDGTAWGIVSLIAIYTVASECDGWEARIGFALTVALAGGILIHDGDATSVGNILFFEKRKTASTRHGWLSRRNARGSRASSMT